MDTLDGRVALVTGGSRGLGRAMAAALGRSGADLVICSRHDEEVSQAGKELADQTGRCVEAVVADVSPNTARLLGDDPWAFLRSIGVARVRIDFGFPETAIRSIASVLPIALNASTLGHEDLAPFADLDVELVHNFYPREWTGLALSSVAGLYTTIARSGRPSTAKVENSSSIGPTSA